MVTLLILETLLCQKTIPNLQVQSLIYFFFVKVFHFRLLPNNNMPDTEKGWQQNKYNQFSQFYDYRLFRYPALLFVSPKCLNFCQSVYKHLGGGMNLQ